MGMRLMPKSEVSQAKATEKRREIDLGLKMAKRVDAVRETLLEEEARLEAFRRAEVGKIQTEIDAKRTELGTLTLEVKMAKAQRDDALKPLTKEWQELAEEKKKVTYATEKAHNLQATAYEADRQAKKAITQASNALARAATREDLSLKQLERTSKAAKEAEKRLRNAQKLEDAAIKLAEDVTAELKHRDAEMAAKERGYTMREASLRNGEEELARGWRLLEDRKAAFERTITRAKR